MSLPRRLILGSMLVFGFCIGAAGCAKPPAPPQSAPATVTVSYPVEREVTDYADFTARISAVDTVNVKAHVWGYLEKVNFKEGALVKKGDVLFEIEPRTYQAALDQAKAKIVQDQAQLSYDDAEYQRNLKASRVGGASQSDLDKSSSARNVDLANIEADKAQLESRQLDLEYTKVVAPVSGRTSKYAVTVGNLIQSGDQGGGTLLTTIVSVDPIYADFDIDERTVQRVRQLIQEGKFKSSSQTAVPVALGLATQEGFPHQGTINFVDNQVNPQTGTMHIRGVFPNKQESLTPGYFARVRVPIGPPHPVLLVSDRSIDNDQGQKILYIVNEANEVVIRPVRLGALHDGLRAIENGLKPGERVVVNGLQRVRPGAIVEPKLLPMPVQRGKDRETGRQGDREKGSPGERETGRQGSGASD